MPPTGSAQHVTKQPLNLDSNLLWKLILYFLSFGTGDVEYDGADGDGADWGSDKKRRMPQKGFHVPLRN